MTISPGRNDPCPCGSGKKFKKCCAAKSDAHPGTSNAPAISDASTSAECDQLLVLFNTGRYAEVENSAHLLIEQYPNSGFLWKALAGALQVQGKDALAEIQKATELMPDDAETHSILGNALQKQGQLDEAVACYRRALILKPDFSMAHSNLGNAFRALGQFEEAVACYHRSLMLTPNYADAHNNLGGVLRDIGRLDDAIASCLRALKINPNFGLAHYNLGNALLDLRRFEEAAASYRLALKTRPDLPEAYFNLGNALRDLGQLDAAVASYRDAIKIKPDYVKAHTNLIFVQNYRSNQPPTMLLAEARHFGDLVASDARPYTIWHNDPSPGKCLRVGMVSGDLSNHPVGYFVEGVVAALAALATNTDTRMEIIAYSNQSHSDALTERIKSYCHGWHPAAEFSDELLAQRIHDDRIDILIDLSGHTGRNRLQMFAWKPAPIQVNWLGYFATTGVAAMDYLIADPWVLPETEEIYFTEKIWRLPETRLCFTAPDCDIEVATLPALSNGYVTFGCFNNLAKMNDEVVALWAKVLAAVPNSRLFLKAKQLRESSMQQSTLDRFVAHGIDAGRITLEEFESRETYLAAYHRIDIALDPFPFPGGTTSVEGLWMGVPVLTLAGDRFLSRQGVGIMMNAGLPDWIAADTRDYVSRAVAHAGDIQRLAELRSRLRRQVLTSPLFDAPRFARHFEEALRNMWTLWCRHKKTI